MKPSVVVVGSLNTDIIISGVEQFPKPGQQVYATSIAFGAGGKSRNIAQMIATLTSRNVVAMIGKSIKDQYGLWKLPIDALKKSGVITDYIKILTLHKSIKFPGIAIIPVNKTGNNSIYVIPGINDDFSKEDINSAERLIKTSKFMVATFEKPIETSLYAIKTANKYGVKVLLDPGGISEAKNPEEVLEHKLFLLKPNEHEAQILTSVKVKDFQSAKIAAKKLLSGNIENLLITHGENGAYFFNNNFSKHIKVPKVKTTNTRDETGCGDQTLAAITASLYNGKAMIDAINIGVLAGTLQFYNPGIIPITKSELGL